MSLGVLADHLGGAVGGAVVDDDHAGAELARDRRQVGEQAGDVLRLVVGGDDEADHAQDLQAAGGTGMSSSSTGRRSAADSRTASAAASALTPSWALTGSGVSSSTQRQKASSSARSGSALAQREPHRGALGVAAQHREPVPVQRRRSVDSTNQTSWVM